MPATDDAECPFCWGTGVIVMVYDNCTTTQPCPEGCLAPDEVPF